MEDNLMDALFSEINRVREIIKEYEDPSMKGAGHFAALFMKQEIDEAERAIKEGDTIQMMVSYNKLKENEL